PRPMPGSSEANFSLPGSFNRNTNPASFTAGRQNLSANLRMDWVLFDGFAIQANKARFALLEKQSEGNAALIIENTLEAVILAYQDAQLAQAQLDVLRDALQNSRAQREVEAYRKDIGAGGSFELLQFENAVLTDSINVISQQLTLRNALRLLAQLLALPPATGLRLTDQLDSQTDTYAWEALRERMLADNRSLRTRTLDLALRREETRLAQAARYPQFSINASTNYVVGDAILRNLDPSTSEANPTFSRQIRAFDYTAGFTLSFNLFNGGQIRRQITRAGLNEAIAETQIDELRLGLEHELRDRFDAYQAQQEVLGLQNLRVDQAQTQLDLAAERAARGLINSLDYRLIQVQYLTAKLDQLRALTTLKGAETSLLRLTGGLLRE
ncbi:MAG: TolC family protein, partial [Bacteroidota bacterium]